MKESREHNLGEQPQTVLKTQFLNGEITAQQFIEEIDKLDQLYPDRRKAENNLNVLNDDKVRKQLATDPSAAWDVANMLSLTHLHIAQRILARKEHPGMAKEAFQKALKAAEGMHLDGDEQWRFYIEANIAHLDADFTALEILFEKLEDGKNRDIVGQMIADLKNV